MKRLLWSCLLLLVFAYPVPASDALTYDGKVIAQVERKIAVPFPILVDKLLVSIGEDARKGQQLLEYHLEARDARGLQYELMTGGDAFRDKMELGRVDQELLDARAKAQAARDLAARGLGSSVEASRLNRNQSLIQQRKNNMEQTSKAASASFNLRLKELESYFGQPLKVGQPIPAQLFLTSPIDATIIDISPQARPLGTLSANATIMTMAVLNPIQVQIQVHESEISRLSVGMPVTVEVVNTGSDKLSGHVSMLSLQPVDPAIAVPSFYNAYVDIDNPEHLLKPGYKVLVHLELADK